MYKLCTNPEKGNSCIIHVQFMYNFRILNKNDKIAMYGRK